MRWAQKSKKTLIVTVKNTERPHMLDLQPGP